MNYEEFFKRQRNIVIITIISVVIVAIGVSYAVFMQIDKNTNNQVVTTGDLVVTYEKGNTITEEMVPISNSDAMASGYEGYAFTVKNTGSLDASYKVTIYNNPEGSNLLSHDQMYISFDGSTPVILSSINTDEEGSYLIHEGSVASGATNNHLVKLWIREDASTDIIGKNVNLIMEVESIVYEDSFLRDLILAQGGGETAIIELPVSSFAKTATNSGTETATNTLLENGIFKTVDEYGTSYYYRGVVTKNNVLFGGFQWKIIRINGDGSIRLMYNGTEAEFNTNGIVNTTGANTAINSTIYKWSPHPYTGDNKYGGYMYGGSNGVASTSRITDMNNQNYANSNNAVYNQTNSNAKTVLDTWYETNIKGKAFESLVVDNIFCNDRQLRSEVGGAATGTGIGSNATIYAAYYRANVSKTPTFKCGLVNDQFTINSSNRGNKVLTYPIGLITGDEVLYAGAIFGNENTSYYLKTNQVFVTLSASEVSSRTDLLYVNTNGALRSGQVDDEYGLRAVINLDKNVVAKGDGSSSNPFRVQ